MTDWYSPEAATFGDRVAAAREAAGLSQEQLSRRIGIRTPTLRKWENDTSEPRANRLSMLAGVLNVSMMWLINGEGEGLDAPEEGGDVPAGELEDVLTELRALRTDMTAKAQAIGRLEKRVRAMVRDQHHV